VVKNIKERLKGCDEVVRAGIIKDINYLHFCRNDFEFNIAKHNIYTIAKHNEWFK
jgi:hypothetical protein